MAIPNWITVTPSSAYGDKTVNVTASENTGRNSRTYTLTAICDSDNNINSKTVIRQSEGKQLFMSTNDLSIPTTVPNTGGKYTIGGYSNLAKLQIAVSDLRSCDFVNGVFTINGQIYPEIQDFNEDILEYAMPNIGLAEKYAWTLTFDVTPNTSAIIDNWSVDFKTFNEISQLYVSLPIIWNISTLPSTPRMNVMPTTVQYTEAGGTKPIAVISNDNWDIS